MEAINTNVSAKGTAKGATAKGANVKGATAKGAALEVQNAVKNYGILSNVVHLPSRSEAVRDAKNTMLKELCGFFKVLDYWNLALSELLLYKQLGSPLTERAANLGNVLSTLKKGVDVKKFAQIIGDKDKISLFAASDELQEIKRKNHTAQFAAGKVKSGFIEFDKTLGWTLPYFLQCCTFAALKPTK